MVLGYSHPTYRVGLSDLQSPIEALTSTTQGRVYRITDV